MKNPLLVISAYPPKGSLYGHKMTGAASYTKNTLLQLKKHLKGKITVLAETEGEIKQETENGISIHRVWKRGGIKLYLNILKEVFTQKHTKDVLFAFEWSMFSDKRWHLLFVPIMIAAMRAMGKRVVFVSHAVLLDAGSVAGQMGAVPDSAKMKLLSIALKGYYWLTVQASSKVVLFEEGFRQELRNLTGQNEKLLTIPHGVDRSKKSVSSIEARKSLGYKNEDLVIMYFGFLIWYKGADWIVESAAAYLKKNTNATIKLLVAGGENPRFENDPVYKSMVNKIYKLAEEHKSQIKVTGFVKENEIPLYFSAADVLMMPYRAFVSSSGPLSFAFSTGKPVVFSDKLAGYFDTPDMANALNNNAIPKGDILFPLSQSGFESAVNRCGNKAFLAKLGKFSNEVGIARSWEKTGNKYANIFK